MSSFMEDYEALKEAFRSYDPADFNHRAGTGFEKGTSAGERNETDWLDGVKEIINYARISRSSFWRYVKKGFPAKKVMGTVVSRKSWIDAWKTEAPDLVDLNDRREGRRKNEKCQESRMRN